MIMKLFFPKPKVFFLLTLLLCVAPRRSLTQGLQLVPPKGTTTQPVVNAMKKTVLEVTTVCNQSEGQEKSAPVIYRGTGFILVQEDPTTHRSWNYLVSNRHVAQPGIEHGSACNVLEYQIRINMKNPDQQGNYSRILTSALPVGWFFPNDSAIDLAVAPISLDPITEDIKNIPADNLVSDELSLSENLTEGDPILFTGLFVQFSGETRLEPIVRTGKIAMLPNESVPTTLGTPGKVLLVDAHVFGGNSGSPVFVDLGGSRGNTVASLPNYKLLGIISGYMKESANFELESVASYAGTMDANSGIAIVVLAQQLLDLLDSTQLKAFRTLALRNPVWMRR